MFRELKYLLGCSLLLVAALFWLAYFSTRPQLTIDPATLAGDGSQTNYCELPLLVRTSASMIWEEKLLNFYEFGWGPRVVRRC